MSLFKRRTLFLELSAEMPTLSSLRKQRYATMLNPGYAIWTINVLNELPIEELEVLVQTLTAQRLLS